MSKGPCESCGSSDACETYPDGHKFCFSCETFTQTDGEPMKAGPTAPRDLIRDLEFIPLKSRKIHQETLVKFSYGVHNGRHVATYYGQDNRPCAQKIRTKDKAFSWKGDPSKATLFGQQLWAPGGKQLVITEGEIDCLSVAQALSPKLNWPVVSIPNGAQSALKSIKANLTFVESFSTIILCFDMDEPGQKAAREVAAILRPGSVKIAQLPGGRKDASDCLQAGDDLGSIIRFQSADYRPDGIINAADIWDTLVDFREGRCSEAFRLAYPELQAKTYGIRKGEITMLTAGTGSGKSTLAHEIGYDLLVNQGLTLGVAALEESDRITGLRYMSLHVNRRLHLDPKGISMAEYQEAFEATAGSGRLMLYDHFGSLESDALLEKLRYLAVGCDCDFIILDHISIAVSGLASDDERKTLDILMTNLRSLCENTGVGIIAVCHLRRKGSGQTGHEDGGRVSLADLRGTGGIAQLSDTVLAVERDQQDEDSPSQLRVLKCRWTGLTGPADKLKFNLETGRYTLYEEGDASFPEGENNDF